MQEKTKDSSTDKFISTRILNKRLLRSNSTKQQEGKKRTKKTQLNSIT